MTDPAVVAALADERPEDDDEGEQLGLFAEPETEQGRAKVAHVQRGRGRPAGSRNKRTERTLAWIRARHKDPLEGLLEVANLHPADLAALAGCTIIEAIQEQRLCRLAALPFIHQRLPIAVDLTNRSVVYLTINEGGQLARATAGSLAMSILETGDQVANQVASILTQAAQADESEQ